MEFDAKGLASIIAAAVGAQLAPLQQKIVSLESQLAEAYKEPQPQPQVDTEAQEAAEAASYIAQMKARLQASGLMPDTTEV